MRSIFVCATFARQRHAPEGLNSPPNSLSLTQHTLTTLSHTQRLSLTHTLSHTHSHTHTRTHTLARTLSHGNSGPDCWRQGL